MRRGTDVATAPKPTWSFKGRAWRFGDNIDADTACQFYANLDVDINDAAALARICMTGYDPEFPNKAKKGDFIVAGKNFGRGHMHAHFYYSIKALGIAVVVAESVGFRLYREMINSGIPIVICPTTKSIKDGERITVDLEKGTIVRDDAGETLQSETLSGVHREIIKHGGIDGYISAHLNDH